MKIRKIWYYALLCVAMGTVIAPHAWTQQNPHKFALVIGNGAYTGIPRLNNPVNDANDMAAVLEGLGFTVEKIQNGSLAEIENAILRLKNNLSGSRNTYGFFFYADHGVQSNGNATLSYKNRQPGGYHVFD